MSGAKLIALFVLAASLGACDSGTGQERAEDHGHPRGSERSEGLGRRARDPRADEIRRTEALRGTYLDGVVSGLPFSAMNTAASFTVALPLLVAW